MIINTKVYLTRLERTLEYKSLLCGHLEQEVIKIHYVTSSVIYDNQIALTICSSRTVSTKAFVQIRLHAKYYYRIYACVRVCHTNTRIYINSPSPMET